MSEFVPPIYWRCRWGRHFYHHVSREIRSAHCLLWKISSTSPWRRLESLVNKMAWKRGRSSVGEQKEKSVAPPKGRGAFPCCDRWKYFESSLLFSLFCFLIQHGCSAAVRTRCISPSPSAAFIRCSKHSTTSLTDGRQSQSSGSSGRGSSGGRFVFRSDKKGSLWSSSDVYLLWRRRERILTSPFNRYEIQISLLKCHVHSIRWLISMQKE